MPLQNFWITASSPTRMNDVRMRSNGKHGELSLTVRMRDQGASVVGVEVVTFAESDGTLWLRVKDAEHNTVYEKKTQR